MKKMKKIYLHIGMPKTGTTAIQLFLKDNERALKKHNIVFPQDYMNLNVKEEFELSCGNLANFFMGFSNDNRALKIKELHDKYEQDIIISSERIWSNFATQGDDFLKTLKSICSDAEIIIIVYLRKQVDFFESMYLEEIKCWKEIRSIYEIERNSNYSLQLEYVKLLAQLVELFGREQCNIRLYEKKEWKNQNLIEDFLDAIGIEDVNEFVFSSEKINFSLDKLASSLKRQINQTSYGPREISKTFLVPLLKSTQLHAENGRTELTYSYFSPDEKDEFMKQYGEENHFIAREFFGRESIFEGNSNVKKYEDASLQEIVEEMIYVFSSVEIENSVSIKKSQRRVNTVDKKIEKLQTKLENVEKDLKEDLSIEKEEYRNEILELKNIVDRYESHIEILEKEYKEAIETKQSAEISLEGIKNSKSWKVTEPFRRIWSFMHR
jgi:hypothetical protein